MTKNTEINVFIENEYPDFELGFDLASLVKDVENMLKFFLTKKDWVKDSCLANYTPKLLYFDAVLCDDEKIQEINRDYREKDTPTDVISFAIFADSPENERFVFDDEINLGEIIISLDRAKIQSQDNSHHQQSFKDELYFLFAHGILHLLGFDHQSEDELQKMWTMQQNMIEGKNV